MCILPYTIRLGAYNEPMITVYSDRIEILSRGTLPREQTMEGFFSGESIPVNKKLSEIFLQLHISEKTGRSVPKITEKYGKDTFEFRENAIVVKIPFNWINVMGNKLGDKVDNKVGNKSASSTEQNIHLNETQLMILNFIRDNNNITKKQLQEKKRMNGWDTCINIPPKLMMSILIRLFFNYLMWTNVIFHFNNYGNQ